MKLNFKTFGEGEPIIILHGLFGSLDNWQTLGKKLAENYLVYLVDLRNHGKSHRNRTEAWEIISKPCGTVENLVKMCWDVLGMERIIDNACPS